MAQPSHDWHPEDIKAAIRRSGTSLAALSTAAGLTRCACSFTLSRPWPAVQKIIAKRLGVPPQSIWPSRYDAAGDPLPRKQITHPTPAAHRQKAKAA